MIAASQLELGFVVSGSSGFLKQCHGFFQIGGNAVPVQIADSQLAFCRNISLICGLLKPICRFLVFLVGGDILIEQAHAQSKLSIPVILLGGAFQPFLRQLFVLGHAPAEVIAGA